MIITERDAEQFGFVRREVILKGLVALVESGVDFFVMPVRYPPTSRDGSRSVFGSIPSGMSGVGWILSITVCGIQCCGFVLGKDRS